MLPAGKARTVAAADGGDDDPRAINRELHAFARGDQPHWYRDGARCPRPHAAQRGPGWITHVFLLTTTLTTITGFLFPITAFTPALGTGIVSLGLLIPALLGFYVFRLASAWRWIYAATAIAAFYLNSFVLVVQLFQKLPALQDLAPTQSEPPFLIAQVVLLLAFLWFGYRAVRQFHPPALAAA